MKYLIILFIRIRKHFSLLFLFLQNAQTAKLLPVMGIYTDELARIFSFTDLNQFRQ